MEAESHFIEDKWGINIKQRINASPRSFGDSDVWMFME